LLNASAAVSSFLISSLTKRNISWGRPFILTIEPTNHCNLSCPLCITGNNRMTRDTGVMSFETYKRIIDQLGDYIFYLLLYQQGEPFINKQFLAFVRYAKANRIFVTTSTNGHYLNEKQAAATVASGLDSMIVSIDGTDQSTYSKYRVNGELKKVLSGISNIVNEKRRQKSQTPKLYIQFIVMKHNEHQVTNMRELSKRIGANQLLIKTVFVDSACQAQAWLPRNETYRRYQIENNQLSVKKTVTGSCYRPWTSSLINWDGDTVPCCFDKDGNHVFGNTDDKMSFTEIWRSRGYSEFRSEMLNNRKNIDICSNCTQGLRLFR